MNSCNTSDPEGLLGYLALAVRRCTRVCDSLRARAMAEEDRHSITTVPSSDISQQSRHKDAVTDTR